MKVICQKWEESERGWGTRPDGYSLHLTEEDRKKYIAAYVASLPDEVPDEYERIDGTPYACKVDDETMTKLKDNADKHGMRFYNNNYPGDGGKDGWVTRKSG